MMRDNTPPIDEVQLRRYLDRSGSPEDVWAVEAWLRAEPLARELIRGLQEASAPVEDVEAVWRRIAKEMKDGSPIGAQASGGRRFERSGVSEGKKGRLVNQTLPGWLWTGAITAVIATTLFLVHRIPANSSEISRTYATNSQQQAIVNLEDGSRATLAPHSTLRVRHIGTQSRVLLLEDGEAYFEVAHASGVPFDVQSGSVTTHVLGTAFLIRHRAGDAHVHVAVMDGKLRVSQPMHAHAAVTLTAGQIGDIIDSTVHVSRADDLASDAEWSNGQVMFRHTSVATVLETVSRWYGYYFRYADSAFGTRKVTMIVSTRSSAEALSDLERVLEVNLTVLGDTITLVPQPVRSSRSTPRVRTYDVWTPNNEVGR